MLFGCSGESTDSSASPTAPTSPTASTPSTPVSSPTVRVDVTYYTNHNSTDPDHWRLQIYAEGTPPYARSVGGAYANNPAARTPGTITWTGPLAPGRYIAVVELYEPDRSIDIAFAAAPGSATGGVERNSLRFKESNSSPVNVYNYRPCGVTTTYTRRPDLAGFSLLHLLAFEFAVSASATATC